jgi:ABC-type branched-subunit amino acid transport system ATPase component
VVWLVNINSKKNMAESVILQIENISKSFSSLIKGERSNKSNVLLDGFTLGIKKGNITALIGGNGAGKTTLFNIISGFLKADSGAVYFENGGKYNITNFSPYRISRLGVGRVFQDNHIFNEMSVIDNMLIADDNRFGERAFESFLMPKKNNRIEKNRRDEAEMIFNALFGANNTFISKRYDKAGSLSFGEQRLLGMARLMMADNKLLLLDEPTAGLNNNLISQIASSIKKMVEVFDTSVFLIEHNMGFVSEIADSCIFMANGKTEVIGSPEEVFKSDYVRKNYLK